MSDEESVIDDSESELDRQYDDVEDIVGDLMHRKHIETLKFLREVLNENKELRDRMRLLENSQPDPPEYTVNLLHERDMQHEIVQHRHRDTQDEEVQTNETCAHYDELQRQWNLNKSEYERELQRVDAENEDLHAKNNELIDSNENLKTNINVLNENLNRLKHENLELQDQMQELMQLSDEIPYLQGINRELEENLAREEIISKESMLKIKDLEERVEESHKQKIQMKINFHGELERQKETLSDHANCAILITNLEKSLDYEKHKTNDLNIEINNLNDYIAKLNDEITSLNEKLHFQEKNMNFKEFVMLKRELNALRQERNQALLSTTSNSCKIQNESTATSPLPPLKETLLKKKFTQIQKNSF